MAGQVILYRAPAEQESASLFQRVYDFISSETLQAEPTAITNIYANILTASPTFAVMMLLASIACIYVMAKSMKSVSG